MVSLIKAIVRPRSLTHCVLDNSFIGKVKNHLWQKGLNAGRVQRQSASNPLDAVDSGSVAKLRKDGIAIGQTIDFLGAQGLAALKAGEELIRAKVASKEVQDTLASGQKAGQHKNYLVHIVDFNETLPADHPLLGLALDERLLKIVANYMGMWPQLHAIGSWYNFPVDQDLKASQLWHRDPEDLKTVKVFIYLDDVGAKQGPFTFIPGSQPFGKDCGLRPIHKHPRRVLDDEMETAFAKSRWLDCTGKAGTMIIADTVGYHRGGHVQEGHRLLITFTYTSGTPQQKRKLSISGIAAWAKAPLQVFALKN